jgi:GMP synthase (glutamine-hydrolysing)
MRLAGILYEDLVHKFLPDAQCDIWYSSDPDAPSPPTDDELAAYDGVIWPGCNLTIYHDDPRVKRHLELAALAYEVGVPQFGSCWGIQIAVYTAGGEVAAHPKGREMGLARKIHLTEAGKTHPMFEGKPEVYCHLVSHDDHIVKVPSCVTVLAGNYHSPVQAVAVEYKKGVFWATQYHPEYDIHEIAALLPARAERLIKQGFFRDHDDLVQYAAKLDTLFADPSRKDLRWQLDIDDDILSDEVRTCEFRNWIEKIVVPRASA